MFQFMPLSIMSVFPHSDIVYNHPLERLNPIQKLWYLLSLCIFWSSGCLQIFLTYVCQSSVFFNLRQEVLGIEPNTMSMLGRNSTSETHSQSLHFSKFLFQTISFSYFLPSCLSFANRFLWVFIGINIKSSNTFLCRVTDLQPCLRGFSFSQQVLLCTVTIARLLLQVLTCWFCLGTTPTS